jgi:phosphonate transport system substrate-binding protein
MIHRFRLCVVIWGFLLGAAAPFVVASAAGINSLSDEIIIALKPDKNPDAMMAEREALAGALGEALGRRVKVIVPLSSAVIIEGLANGSIDLGYLSATDMVNARQAEAAEILLVGEIDGQRHYASVWLCLAEKPYQSIADLRGKPVAFASRTSTSGYLIPLLDLKKQNLIEKSPKEFFGAGQVWFGTGYLTAVERVLAGEAEAAAVSDYVFAKDKHLAPGQKAKLKILDTQGPVPTHVMAVSSQLDEAARDSLREALTAMGEKNPTLRDMVFTSKLVETDADNHLASVAEALEFAREPHK